MAQRLFSIEVPQKRICLPVGTVGTVEYIWFGLCEVPYVCQSFVYYV